MLSPLSLGLPSFIIRYSITSDYESLEFTIGSQEFHSVRSDAEVKHGL